MQPPVKISATIAQVIKNDWGRILSVLTRMVGDLALAEDCLQDAALTAMNNWATNGLPAKPDAWLITVAKRKALDRLRRDTNFAAKSAEIAYLLELEATHTPDEAMDAIPDKRLEMIFTCCHPAIDSKSQVALTLRTLGGLTTDEIAAAFLDKPSAMAARLTRAKAKITQENIPYEIPALNELSERLEPVLRVVYLIFNEGFRSGKGRNAGRDRLTAEAIRLARIVNNLLPDTGEVQGLLSLLLLGESRRAARSDGTDHFIPLDQQDRSKWDQGMIREGIALAVAATNNPAPGSYALQAAISALHAQSPTWLATDWAQISELYQLLWLRDKNPVVRVNQSIALSYAKEPKHGLELLQSLENEKSVKNYQPFYVARADILARMDKRTQAVADLRKAIELASDQHERSFLEKRLCELDAQ